MENLYLSTHMHDVVFCMGKSAENAIRFPAHKCVVTLASEVLKTTLTSKTFEEGRTGEVIINDVTQSAFKALLYFAYTGELKRQTITEYPFILYAAQKYLMKKLTKLCLSEVSETALNIDNFWSFWKIIVSYWSELMPVNLVDNTLKFLSHNSSLIINHAEFENLSYSEMDLILSNKYLNVTSELDVFNAVINWAKMECLRLKSDVSPINLRLLLDDIVYKIRYLLMSRDELRNGPIKSQIFTRSEEDLLAQELRTMEGNLQPPWDNELLKLKRSSGSVTCWPFPIVEVTVVEVDSPLHSSFDYVIFACAKNFAFCEVELSVKPSMSEFKIETECEISDLDGNVIKEWIFSKNCTACYETTISIPVEICLMAFKCYKFKVEFNKGILSDTRCEGNFCRLTDRSIFFIGGYKNDNTYDLKCADFWKNAFGLTNNRYERVKCCNSFVKKVSVQIV